MGPTGQRLSQLFQCGRCSKIQVPTTKACFMVTWVFQPIAQASLVAGPPSSTESALTSTETAVAAVVLDPGLPDDESRQQISASVHGLAHRLRSRVDCKSLGSKSRGLLVHNNMNS